MCSVQYSYIENIPLDETINPNEYKVGPGDKLSFNLKYIWYNSALA